MIEFISSTTSFFLHIDDYVGVLVSDYGILAYGILFLIITLETGLVIFPFLPGDSLLFALGAFSAKGIFEPLTLIAILSFAAILGDTINYSIGLRAGEKILGKGSWLLKEEYLQKTSRFYERWGAQTIVVARFVPIVRTFAPFIAGIARMSYPTFAFFNVIGGILWVGGFILIGYFFGNLPVAQNNFGLVICVVIALSILPGVVEYLRARRNPSEN